MEYLVFIILLLVIIASYLIIKYVQESKLPYKPRELVKVKVRNDKGIIVNLYHHIANVKFGKEKLYYPNGRINKSRHWVDGKLEGRSITFFENGRKYIICHYSNNQLHGEYLVKALNGTVLQEHAYVEGKKV